MSLVELERIEDIAVVRLARPPVNAIDLELLRDAAAAMGDLDGQQWPRAIVLTGSGSAFSAGLDLQKVPKYSPPELRQMICGINNAILQIYASRVPVIGALNGHAIAGGLCLALACDYRVCVDSDCKIGLTETRAGIPYPIGPISVVQAELAPHVARQLVLLARNVTPQRALEWGIVDELQPRNQVKTRALEVARDLASAPADGYTRIKQQLRGEVSTRIRRAVEEEDDPLLEMWFGSSAAGAAAKVLAGKAGA
jgi:enoyl-CoA hydratase